MQPCHHNHHHPRPPYHRPDHPEFEAGITRHVRGMCQRVGRNLHAQRQRRGWRLEKLARMSGISARLIDEIELGKGEFNIRCITQLCLVLDIEVATLLRA